MLGGSEWDGWRGDRVGHGQRDGGRALAAGLRARRRLARHGALHAVRVVALQGVVVAGVLGPRLALAAAAVAAAAQAAAEVASCQYAANDTQRLAPSACDNEIGVDIFFSKLFGDVKSERAVIVVNITFRSIAQNGVGSVNFFELI